MNLMGEHVFDGKMTLVISRSWLQRPLLLLGIAILGFPLGKEQGFLAGLLCQWDRCTPQNRENVRCHVRCRVGPIGGRIWWNRHVEYQMCKVFLVE